MVPLRVTVAAAVSGGRLTGGSAVHRLSACGWDRSAGQPCKWTPIAGRRSKSRRMRGLRRAKNARNWRISAGRAAASGWKRPSPSSQQGKGWSETSTRCQRPRGRRLPLTPSPAARAMGGESAHPCFGWRPVEGATGEYFGISMNLLGIGWLSNFAWCCHMVPSASPHCQIKRGHAVRAVSHRFVFAKLCRGN